MSRQIEIDLIFSPKTLYGVTLNIMIQLFT